MLRIWQTARFGLAIAAVGWCLFCLWLWQPERQVRLHQMHLLDAAEGRDWKRFAPAIGADYTDRWGHDKAFLVRETSEVLRQFFALTIHREEIALDAGEGRGRASVRLRLEGNGTAIAQYALRTVNAIETPFVFEWRQRSWKPWDWTLAGADNPNLHIGAGFDF